MKDFLFIHLLKTGGSSINTMMKRYKKKNLISPDSQFGHTYNPECYW